MESSKMNRFRHLSRSLLAARESVRVVVGARQVGKSTLSRMVAPHLRYFNLDASEIRDALTDIPASLWAREVGPAILDECQKLPAMLEKIKYAWDAGGVRETILTGSSQLLLHQKVQESLAGRASLHECWPMMLSELAVETAGQEAPIPLLDTILRSTEPLDALLESVPSRLIGLEESLRLVAENHLLRWGGMPTLLHLNDVHREDWLRDYVSTFLERDLADLARLSDLEPFRKFQRLCALRSGGILNYSELARDCATSVDTSRRWLEYLRVSFQTILLQPYAQNLTSRAIKSPKLYWSDMGLQRRLSGRSAMVTGEVYESHVVAEIHKWIRTMHVDAQIMYYRTIGGMEVDLLLETTTGVIGCEVKLRETAEPRDARHLVKIAQALGERWRGGMVIYRGRKLQRLCEPGIWAVPSHRLL
jgi:predicted AAA+ superfamily ATPase